LIGVGRYGSLFNLYDVGNLNASELLGPTGEPVLYDLNGVACTGDEVVAVGKNGVVFRSETGVGIWKMMESPTPKYLYSVAWTGAMLVAVGIEGTIITSP
jgi:hypothetical protein